MGPEILNKAIKRLRDRLSRSLSLDTSVEWDYQTFRRYQLNLRRGPQTLIRFSDVPHSIELSTPWHELFNKMRTEHQLDGHERWAHFGFNGDQKKIFLPNYAVRGSKNSVETEVMMEEKRRALRKYGIFMTLGSIHSHPTKYLRKKGFEGSSTFSSKDLYHLVLDQAHRSLEVLVDDESNQVVMRTRESMTATIDELLLSQESFSNYWISKYRVNNHGLSTSEFYSRHWRMIAAICGKHYLALYRGAPNSRLTRVFPK